MIKVSCLAKWISSLAVVVIASAASAQQISVTMDGKVVHFDHEQPQNINGTMFVPLRGVFEAMGAEVKWDQPQHMVEIDRGEHIISMRVEGKSAMVDNRAVNMSARAHLIRGNIMIPLRFVSSALGCQIEWHEDSQTVEIKTGPVPSPSNGLAHQRGGSASAR